MISAYQQLLHLQNEDSSITRKDYPKVSIFFFGPSYPLNRKINLTYCFTTRFPASRADWKEQKLAKDSLKTEFSSLQQLLAFLFLNETENRAYINENTSGPLNTWLLLACLLSPRNFSHGADRSCELISVFKEKNVSDTSGPTIKLNRCSHHLVARGHRRCHVCTAPKMLWLFNKNESAPGIRCRHHLAVPSW